MSQDRARRLATAAARRRGGNGPIANRPQINNLPHNSTTLPFGPALKGRATIPE